MSSKIYKGKKEIDYFQELVDDAMASIKNGCENGTDIETYCDDIESIESIKVKYVEYFLPKSYFLVWVETKYFSIFEYVDFHDIYYEIDWRMTSPGLKIVIMEEESINTNKNRQW